MKTSRTTDSTFLSSLPCIEEDSGGCVEGGCDLLDVMKKLKTKVGSPAVVEM